MKKLALMVSRGMHKEVINSLSQVIAKADTDASFIIEEGDYRRLGDAILSAGKTFEQYAIVQEEGQSRREATMCRNEAMARECDSAYVAWDQRGWVTADFIARMVKHGKMVAVGHVGEFEATKRKFKVEPLPFAGDLFDVHADADAALRDDLAHGRREDA